MFRSLYSVIGSLQTRVASTGCGLVLLTVIGINLARAEPPRRVDCDPMQDRLSINAPSNNLFELLSEISGECGIVFKADPSLDREVHLTLNPQPLEPALKSLMRGISYLFVYAQTRTNTGSRRIMEVHLLPQGEANVPMVELPAAPRQKVRAENRSHRPDKAKERKRSEREQEKRRQEAARAATSQTFPGLAAQ
jgi:hypothetical protein